MFSGKYDVVPAGGFERCCAVDEVPAEKEWSIKLNVYRELLEEVYDDKELMNLESPWPDYIYRKPTARSLG